MLGGNGTVSVDLLTIDLTSVNLFVGVGATLAADSTIITTSATGFLAEAANLSVGMAKSTAANDTRRWTGIAASAASMTVVGLPNEFTVEVKDLAVKYNAAAGTSAEGAQATVINWAPVIDGSSSSLEALLSGTQLVVSGVVRLNLGGYVLAGGSF